MKQYSILFLGILSLIVQEGSLAQTNPVINSGITVTRNQYDYGGFGTSYEHKATEFVRLAPNDPNHSGFAASPAQDEYTRAWIDPSLTPPIPYVDLTTADDVNDPIDQSLSVGSIPGGHTVSPTGAVTYSIPIQVPPGTGGMVPRLSINYNSQGGNGLLGIGWGLGGVSSISRVNSTIYHDDEVRETRYNMFDAYSLDGSRLIQPGSYYNHLEAGDILHPESDPFTTVEAVGFVNYNGPASFKVVKKDGSIWYYGATTNSRYMDHHNDAILTYYLNRVEDTHGNFMTYHYVQEDRQCRLSEIRYTGNVHTGLEPYNVIQFEYGERADGNTYYLNGQGYFTTAKRNLLLKRIRIIADGQSFKSYLFDYHQDERGLYSFLNKVTEKGADGSSLNPTIFEYGNTPVHFSESSSDVVAGEGVDLTVADVNGDGLSDLIAAPRLYDGQSSYLPYHTSFKVYLRDSPNGGFTFLDEIQLGAEFHQVDKCISRANSRDFIGSDFTGDGVADILVTDIQFQEDFTKLLSFRLYSYQNGQLIEQIIPNPSSHNKIAGSGYLMVGDFDGNGTTDIRSYLVALDGTYGCLEWKSGQSQLGYVNASNREFYALSNQIHMIDFNGDGLANGMAVKGGDTYIRTGYNTYEAGYPSAWHDIFTGDFNGDGKTDMLTRPIDGSQWQISYSTGISWFTQNFSFSNYVDTESSTHKLKIRDYNGDGMDDILHARSFGSTQTQIAIHYSTGMGFTEETMLIDDVISFSEWVSADFNGDGIVEELSINHYTDPIKIYSFNKDNKERLLTAVRDGMGVQTSFAHTWLSKGDNYDPENLDGEGVQFAGPLSVTKHVVTEDGNGGNQTTSYSFEDGNFYPEGRGFLGFGRAKTNTPAVNRKTVSTYSVDEVFNVSAMTKLETFTSGGDLLTTTDIVPIYEEAYANEKIFWTVTKETHVTDHESNTTVTTINQYNPDGNLTSSSTSGNSLIVSTSVAYDDFIAVGSDIPNTPQYVSNTTSRTGEDAVIRNVRYTINPDNGNVETQIQDPGLTKEVIATYSYDAYGNRLSATLSSNGLDNRESETIFDDKGRFPVEQTNSLGQSELFEYDGRWGKITKSISPDGLVSKTTYDPFGRFKSNIDAIGLTTMVERDWDINPSINSVYKISKSKDNSPNLTTWYDSFSRDVKASGDGFNQSVEQSKTYDVRGRVTSSLSPHFAGNMAQAIHSIFTYDDRNRLETSSDGLQSATTVYNAVPGWTTATTTDGYGRSTAKIVDNSGKVINATDDGGQLTFSFDSHGNQIEVKDDNQVVLVKSEFDEYGRQTKLIDINGGTIEYEYNAFGELVYQKDALGTEITIEYDELGRVTNKVNSEEGTTSYQYFTSGNGLNQIKRITAPNGTYRSYTYDELGRPETETDGIDGMELTRSFQYDSYGNVIGKTYPSQNGQGLELEYTYDSNSNGFMTGILASAGSSFEVLSISGMDALGNVTQYTSGNGLETQRAYNKYGMLETSITGSIINEEYVWDAGRGVLDDRYDHIASLHEWFTHDDLNRLRESEVELLGGPLTYSYSPVITNIADNGNIEFKSDAGDYTYDDQKINAVRTASNDEEEISLLQQDISYTATDRTATIREPNGLVEMSFTYGPDDNRVKSVLTINEDDGTGNAVFVRSETRYYFGDFELLRVDHADGTQDNYELSYINSPAGPVGIFVRHNADAGTMFYTYTDHLGSLTHLTDSNGDIVYRQNYDAWGRARNPQIWSYALDAYQQPALPSGVPDPSEWLNRGYTGHEHHAEFALINMNNRMYDPVLGRMLSVDNFVQNPLSTQSYNRYSYVHNNPLTFVDPSGEIGVLAAIGVAAAIAAVAYLVNVANNDWEWNPSNWSSGSVVVGVQVNPSTGNTSPYGGGSIGNNNVTAIAGVSNTGNIGGGISGNGSLPSYSQNPTAVNYYSNINWSGVHSTPLEQPTILPRNSPAQQPTEASVYEPFAEPLQENGVRPVEVLVTSQIVGKGLVRAFPDETGYYYTIPYYRVIVSGNGESENFEAIRFGVQHNSSRGIGPRVVGLADEQTHSLNWITTSRGMKAWQVSGNHLVHDGPDYSTHAFASLGCVEICGVNGFLNFNNAIRRMSGSQNLLSIGASGLLTITYQAAPRPPLIIAP